MVYNTPVMKVLAKNRRAFHDYDITDRFEAGIALTGAEVKAAKSGLASIKEAYVKYIDGSMWLWNASIQRYQHAEYLDSYDPNRNRRLLLHKREIKKIARLLDQSRLTAVPLKLFEVRGLIKVEIGVGKGLRKYDKQKRLKKRDEQRSLQEERKRLGIV